MAGSLGLAACTGSATDDTDAATVTVTVTGTADPVEATESAAGVPDLQLGVREDAGAGSTEPELEQLGSAAVVVSVATLDDGTLGSVEGPEGDAALDFPDFAPESPYPRAVIRVTPPGGLEGDPLAPGSADFTFGADFWLDRTTAGSAVDNGDNLVQRGLASDPSQFKLEIDGGRARCRIQGSLGAVEVRSTGTVSPETWHRAHCSREGDTVRLSVAVLRSDGTWSGAEITSVEAVLGELAWPKPETPVAIGGKLAANGHVIRSATDQFNGRLANPVLDLGER